MPQGHRVPRAPQPRQPVAPRCPHVAVRQRRADGQRVRVHARQQRVHMLWAREHLHTLEQDVRHTWIAGGVASGAGITG